MRTKFVDYADELGGIGIPSEDGKDAISGGGKGGKGVEVL